MTAASRRLLATALLSRCLLILQYTVKNRLKRDRVAVTPELIAVAGFTPWPGDMHNVFVIMSVITLFPVPYILL